MNLEVRPVCMVPPTSVPNLHQQFSHYITKPEAQGIKIHGVKHITSNDSITSIIFLYDPLLCCTTTTGHGLPCCFV